MSDWRVIVGDCIEGMRSLEAGSVHCCVTSPPYFGLRSYLPADHPDKALEMGAEDTPDAFVARLVDVFREVRRVLRDDATLWVVIGDSYATDSKWGGSTGGKAAKALHGSAGGGRGKTRVGLPDKNLIGIPWRLAFALQADGWILRDEIIWSKPNAMPGSQGDRCTRAHEQVFMFSKSARYHYDLDAIKEPAVSTDIKKFTDKGADKQRGHGRRHAGFNGRYAEKLAAEGVPKTRTKRSVWTVATKAYAESHYAVFPPDLIEPCILAGCPSGGTVLDPFGGSGTVAGVAIKHGRHAILCELNEASVALMADRVLSVAGAVPDMFREAAE
jgi:DNA modification methylase